MDTEKEKRESAEKTAKENQVVAAIRSKVGTDEKAFTRVKDMYSIMGIEANTPEEIEKKILASIGALRTTEPDIVASVNGFGGGGGYIPPVAHAEGEKSFADTEEGKKFGAELGLKLEVDKK